MSLNTLRRTTSYVGLAKDTLHLRTNSEQSRRRTHNHICRRMGKLHGIPQKIGQMLSFSNPSSSDGFNAEYSSLQESGNPLPWSDIRPLLESSWGQSIDQVLTGVEHYGKAASLGQVHRARLCDGREIAIKVQYPGIQQAVQTDLSALGWLAMPLGNLRKGFDLNDYRQVVGEDLQQELDYQQEAVHQNTFFNQWQQSGSIVVPQVIESLSSKTVLVSEWQDGQTWDEIRNSWSRQEKRQLADTLLEMFLTGFFQNGLMQADWHPGNIRFRISQNGPQVVLYDFGCMCQPSREVRLALARLIQATIKRNESPLPLLLAMGFQREYLEPLANKLPAVCSVLFEPFCVTYPYDIGDWKLAERLQAILGDDRWNFRIAGPASFVFVLRAFQGLIHYIGGLEVSRNWKIPFEKAIQSLRSKMTGLSIPTVEMPVDFDCLSTSLRIRVTENGNTKVQITQSALSIERLDELLDDDLKQRIVEEGIDLSNILNDVRKQGYAPGCVFQVSKNNKQVEVSLV